MTDKKVEKIVEAATHNPRVITGEIVALGFACVYLLMEKRRRATDLPSNLEQEAISPPVIRTIENEDGSVSNVFVYVQKNGSQEGGHFKLGVYEQIDEQYQTVGISGTKESSQLHLEKSSESDLTRLQLLRDRFLKLHGQLMNEVPWRERPGPDASSE